MPIYKSTACYPLNPLRWIPANKTLPAGVNTWKFDQGFFYQSIKPWFQTQTDYQQKFNLADNIVIYLDSTATQVDYYILDDTGTIVYTLGTGIFYSYSATGNTDPDFNEQYYTFVTEFSFEDLAMPEGFYYIVAQFIYSGDPNPDIDTIFVSECIQVKENWENTILIEYGNNYQNIQGVIWMGADTPPYWNVRVEGYIDIDPAVHNMVFENMYYQTETLQAIPYRVGELTIGQAGGVPKWMMDKLARIFCLSTFKIEGVEWKLDVDSKWSWKKSSNKSWAMQAGSIMLRDNPQREEWVSSNLSDISRTRIHDIAFDYTYD